MWTLSSEPVEGLQHGCDMIKVVDFPSAPSMLLLGKSCFKTVAGVAEDLVVSITTFLKGMI